MLGSLSELRRTVCTAASAFDPRRLDGEAAATAVQEWARIAHGADGAMGLAAARLANCTLPISAGVVDARDLVAKTTGVTAAQARDAITRGAGLATHVQTRAAATAGALSPAQTAAITDAVGVNPGAEAELLT